MKGESFEFEGFDKQIPYTIYRQEPKNGAAIVFPGFGYSIKMPLLLYTVDVLFENGFDVIAFYNEVKHRNYETIDILAGKSLGTRSIAQLMTTYPELSNCKTILLTPILNDQQLIQSVRESEEKTLIIIGNKDPFFDMGLLEELQKRNGCRCYIVSDADHSLHIEGDVQKTLVTLRGVIEEINVLVKQLKVVS
jgi:pimeloyl-ACP methyl ester carboxylesterase